MATLKDIADQTNVALSTVSRVLNEKPDMHFGNSRSVGIS